MFLWLLFCFIGFDFYNWNIFSISSFFNFFRLSYLILNLLIAIFSYHFLDLFFLFNLISHYFISFNINTRYDTHSFNCYFLVFFFIFLVYFIFNFIPHCFISFNLVSSLVFIFFNFYLFCFFFNFGWLRIFFRNFFGFTFYEVTRSHNLRHEFQRLTWFDLGFL